MISFPSLRAWVGACVLYSLTKGYWFMSQASALSPLHLKPEIGVTIGALLVRIGFRAPYAIIIIRNPQNSIKSIGSYKTSSGQTSGWYPPQESVLQVGTTCFVEDTFLALIVINSQYICLGILSTSIPVLVPIDTNISKCGLILPKPSSDC